MKSTSGNTVSLTSNTSQMKSVDVLTFAYYHFLSQQGLKSLSIRYLNSLYAGLKKIYQKSPQENMYAQFLLQIFGFSPDEFPSLRADQVQITLRTRYLFQLVQGNQNAKHKMKAMTFKQPPSKELTSKTGIALLRIQDNSVAQKGKAALTSLLSMTRLTNGGVV